MGRPKQSTELIHQVSFWKFFAFFRREKFLVTKAMFSSKTLVYFTLGPKNRIPIEVMINFVKFKIFFFRNLKIMLFLKLSFCILSLELALTVWTKLFVFIFPFIIETISSGDFRFVFYWTIMQVVSLFPLLFL